MRTNQKMKRLMFLGGMILLVIAALLVSQSSLVRGVTRDGFASYYLQNAGGAKESYNKMGPFDAVGLTCPDGVSKWKCNTPNEPLNGPAFQPGPDSLFMFKNNQCKPECCPSSYTCDGGCVCSSPDQRQVIASRGGNRTTPEDSL
ncbi:MAG: hypothetical protein EBU66_14020 [Bacteroidetes bacterium]|nr:hypothetical protein [bacterium]NBP65765.1 hypothetical protein [Bacteroidota bacterium]